MFNSYDLEDIVAKDFYFRNNRIIITNTIMLNGFEADVLVITKSDYSVEIECKIKKGDFLNEFKKKKIKHFHYKETFEMKKVWIFIPNRYYFACPTGLIKPEEIPKYAGLIYYDYDNIEKEFLYGKFIKRAPLLHKEKITDKFIRSIAEKLTYDIIFLSPYLKNKRI